MNNKASRNMKLLSSVTKFLFTLDGKFFLLSPLQTKNEHAKPFLSLPVLHLKFSFPFLLPLQNCLLCIVSGVWLCMEKSD